MFVLRAIYQQYLLLLLLIGGCRVISADNLFHKTDMISTSLASFENRVTKTDQSFPDIAQTEIEFCAGSNTPSASDEEYLLALAGFNNAVNEEVLPEAILYPTSVLEVREALNVSLALLEDNDRMRNGQVCVRACGNSFAGVSSACHDGVIIDLTNLNISGQNPDITYDPFTAEVTIGTSVKQGEVLAFLGAHAKSLPLGAWPEICVSGFVLGGGFSEISRAYGMACDHLVEMVIVLPDKDEPVKATRTNEHSDLFWASCGGGGGFGVVISMSFKTFDEPQVLLYEEALPVSQLQPILTWWIGHDRAPEMGVDRETLGFSISMSSKNDHEVAMLKLVYPLPLTVDIDLAQKNFKALILSFLPKKNDVHLPEQMSFTDYNLINVSSETSRQHRCGFWGRHKSNFIKHITMDDVSLLSRHMTKKATLPNLEMASTRRVIINAWGGRIGKNRNTALWGRDAGFEVKLEVEFDPLLYSRTLFSESPCTDSTKNSDTWDAVCDSNKSFNMKRWAEGWLHMASSTLCNYSGDHQCKYSYINHISEFSIDSESYFGDHLPRLKEIKKHYDPLGKMRTSWEVVEERLYQRERKVLVSSRNHKFLEAGTIDKLPMQILGYLPLYDKLPEQSFLRQFNVIFLFAATTLYRDEGQNDGTVKYSCSETCELGFADSSEEKFVEYAKESVKNARSSVLLTVGGHAMNGCWKYCYDREDKLSEDIADYVYNNRLDGVDFNVEEDLSPMLLQFIETLVIKTHYALNTRNSVKKWMLSHAPMAHHCDLNVESAERDFFHGLDYIPLFRRLIHAGHLSFVFVQYYNSWPVASLQKNQMFESFLGHYNRLERSIGADRIVIGMCSGGCQPASVVENSDVTAIVHQLQYYSRTDRTQIRGVGFWKITNPETSVVIRHVFERFRQQDVVELVSEVELPMPAFTIVILATASVFVLVALFSRESSSITSTWNIHKQVRIISKELPGSLPVFIPMYNESIEEVERTCANFRRDTISNNFVRKELMLYFIVDNDQHCDAVKTVLQIADNNAFLDDLEEKLPLQLNVPYYAGTIHGIPFKMFLKGAKSCQNHIKKGKRFSALLFAKLVKNDADTEFLQKTPWAALCLDADVITLPCSIEHLVVQMQCNKKITVTCGNISPSVNQRGLAARVQAAEYFFQNRIIKNSEALFGVVSCCPGAFLLIRFAPFHKAVTDTFSIDTHSSSCLMQNALDLGEDRFLTSLLLIHESNWTSFIPAADCTTEVPDSFAALAKQRRRWFNSNLANDIYILMHFRQLFCSMVVHQDRSKLCCSASTFGIVRFVYLIVSTLARLAGALFSTLFSILLMAKTSDIIQGTMLCATQGGSGSHYFCTNGNTLYYIFVGADILWATILLWSFHHSAKNPTGFFARNTEFWLRVNLTFATALMICGTFAVVIFGEERQKQFLALSAIALFCIFLVLIVNMADSRSSLGIASLFVYAVVGLPFLAFIQPLVAFPQIDNFKWGTRETEYSLSSTGHTIDSAEDAFFQPLVAIPQIDNFKWGTRESEYSLSSTGHTIDSTGHGDKIAERNEKDYSRLRQKEKFLFLAMVYSLNGAVLFGIGFLAGGDSILAIFSCLFIAAQILQAMFGVIRNVHLNRQQKTYVL